MISHSDLIKAINKGCNPFFQEPKFRLDFYRPGRNAFYYRINGYSSAINYRKNDKEKVSVLRWFNDFWLYIEIDFIENDIFISISVFQGSENDDKKHQLFRLEWDDRDNHGERHPQPHWHITTDFAISESYKEFVSDEETYESYELVKKDIIDIKEIHFAMNGNWHNDDSDVHKIDNEKKIVKWFQGVLNHLRVELSK